MAETGLSPRTGKKMGEEQHWQVLQKRTFTRYMNSKLKCRGIAVTDLYEDLKSGIVLYNFLEVLTGDSLKRFGKLNKGKMRIQQVANQNVVFAFFPEADIKLENIGVMDVVDGRPVPVLGLIWSIIAFYLVKELGESGDDLAAVKRKILKWCKKHAEKKVPVHNLTESFADGKAFLAILNDIDNAGSPYKPSETEPRDNYRTAFADAEEKYGLPQMLDPEDERLWEDEISMMTYLATMMDTLPDSVAQPDPASLVESWLDDHAEEEEDDLARLCACRSTPTDAGGRAAARGVVDEMIAKGDLDGAGGDAETAVASWVVDPALPTVLLYASTAVDDGADELFEPLKKDGRLAARGATADKANVVSTLYAVRALKATLTGSSEHNPPPPCNVTVCVGSAPPADFTVPPGVEADYVLVSEPPAPDSPHLGALAPTAKAAALYGCRGEMELTVSCVGPAVEAATHVGPLIDPALALASKLASLRDRATAAPSGGAATVAGLPSLSLDLVDFDSGGEPLSRDAVVAAAKRSVDYLPAAKTAPEFAATKPALAALCLDPALVVAKFWTEDQPTPYALPAKALAALRVALPPGYDDLEGAAHKLEEALAAAGFGFELGRDRPLAGRPGYLSDSRQPMAAVLAETLLAGTDEPPALAADPEFAHVPVAFADALPDAAVFQILGLPRDDADAVRYSDLHAWTKRLARLVNASDLPKRAPKLKPYGVERRVEAAPVATKAVASIKSNDSPLATPPSTTKLTPPPPPPPAQEKKVTPAAPAKVEDPPARRQTP
eukprot:CAMPEP_0197401292 /NCGR_PEP_ID=MMETSP1165-20131217/18277_1 /TAXON_ID=284809 /ORGANISM="Chrysocystis fragilis, Strain CCMP3189" /LENGTH=781 /DNA_ID=CAMNT_0042927401 /DNA_START=42 /DNA_END=2383 /DNA_ORIENTATION=-